jgi:2,4-dienoyl-CoA reductase-like NADH-dependent reductase (Old Yellow Enzyme family)
LTHSGRYSYPARIIACRNPVLDPRHGLPEDYPVISDDDLERLEDAYVEAARLAADAGFRAVDIKAVHGYLVNELLSARLRPGRYGGPLENRARFLGNVIGKIRAALGRRMLIAVRLGCFDGVPFTIDPATGLGVPAPHPLPYLYGFGVDQDEPHKEDLREVKQLIGWLVDWGVELLNVSIGVPYLNPHFGRPFEQPDDGNYQQPEHPLVGVDRHFRIAGELQRSFPALPMVGTGYSWLQHFMLHAAAHNVGTGAITLFGAGRAALPYPDFAHDALTRGELDPSRVCRTLTFCSYLMRRKNHPLGQFPTGCVPYDKRIYGPIMKLARASERKP